MRTDRPLLGIVLMLAFCVLAPTGDALAKLLGGQLPLLELLTARFGIQAIMLAPVFWLVSQRAAIQSRLFWVMVLRTVLHILGIGAMFLSLRYLPLADAIAIAFVFPFILLILARFVLNEEIGARRIGACVVGFAGTLLVIQPSFVDVGLPALLPLAVAVIFALFILVTRMIANQINPVPMQAISGVIALGFLLPLLIGANIAGLPGFDTSPPGARDMWLLLAMGVLGTGAHLVMTWALRFAPASTLAPMQYLEIPVATAIGWLVFRDFPNGLALVGITITVAAGIYIILRERGLSRASARASPHQAPPAA